MQDVVDEFHGFADASTQAYGAALYLRTINHEGKISVRLIAIKTRVAPINVVSVHQLELEATLLLTKLIDAMRGVRAFNQLPLFLLDQHVNYVGVVGKACI